MRALTLIVERSPLRLTLCAPSKIAPAAVRNLCRVMAILSRLMQFGGNLRRERIAQASANLFLQACLQLEQFGDKFPCS